MLHAISAAQSRAHPLYAGMEWLHSCPLDDDLDISTRNSDHVADVGYRDAHRKGLDQVCITTTLQAHMYSPEQLRF